MTSLKNVDIGNVAQEIHGQQTKGHWSRKAAAAVYVTKSANSKLAWANPSSNAMCVKHLRRGTKMDGNMEESRMTMAL